MKVQDVFVCLGQSRFSAGRRLFTRGGSRLGKFSHDGLRICGFLNDTISLPDRIELHQFRTGLTSVKSRLCRWNTLPELALNSEPAEAPMRAHQIMTRPVITVTPEASIVEAANTMLARHVSGLPVVDASGKLVGIVSEGDFIRRGEIGTQRRRGRWLKLILGPGKSATDFVRAHGRKVAEIMTSEPLTITEDTALEEIVQLMEKSNVKRLPVTRGERIVGIVSRANLLQAVASLARQIPDPTADDDHIRNRILGALERSDWCPFGLSVVVRDGVVHLSGVITEERSRQAAVVAAENVAGVNKVHDHLCWVDTMSGMYLNSPEDDNFAKAG
jgi:CBS domain-containing protein